MRSASIVEFPALPAANLAAHRAAVDEAISRVLDSGWFINGREVAAFEKEFAAYLGAPHCCGVANGTDAIEIALRAAGIGPGDLVASVSHTAVATVAAIERAGATPVFVDVDPETRVIDTTKLAETLRSPIGRDVRAVVAVHLYGRPASIPDLLVLRERHGFVLIEDCAQAHGTKLGGRRVGTFGDFGAFSFYPTKNLGAIGDGGAVVTTDEGRDRRVRELRQYGWRERYISHLPGVNTRLDELQAAILRAKLPHLESENAMRRELAGHYRKLLAALPIKTPVEPADGYAVYHLYVVECNRRDNALAFLSSRGIPAALHYPAPVHRQPAYTGRGHVGAGGLLVTERLQERILTLPLHPHLNEEHTSYVAARLAEFFETAPAKTLPPV